MRCLRCRYDLQGQACAGGGGGGHRCPECGCEFDPQDPATYLTAARISERRVFAWFAAYAAALAIAAFVLDFPVMLVLLVCAVPAGIMLIFGPLPRKRP